MDLLKSDSGSLVLSLLLILPLMMFSLIYSARLNSQLNLRTSLNQKCDQLTFNKMQILENLINEILQLNSKIRILNEAEKTLEASIKLAAVSLNWEVIPSLRSALVKVKNVQKSISEYQKILIARGRRTTQELNLTTPKIIKKEFALQISKLKAANYQKFENKIKPAIFALRYKQSSTLSEIELNENFESKMDFRISYSLIEIQIAQHKFWPFSNSIIQGGCGWKIKKLNATKVKNIASEDRFSSKLYSQLSY